MTHTTKLKPAMNRIFNIINVADKALKHSTSCSSSASVEEPLF